MNPSVVTSIFEEIDAKFGKMKVTRGKDHVFLGMNVCLNSNKTVSISMDSYRQDAIDSSNLNITSSASSPAAKHLFIIHEQLLPLDKTVRDNVHIFVAKRLYVSLKARPDL
jgi:hypothetical protein